MPAEKSDNNAILDEAQQRARKVLEAVQRDAQSLRGSRPGHEEGARLCENVASALQDLISQLEPGKTAP